MNRRGVCVQLGLDFAIYFDNICTMRIQWRRRSSFHPPGELTCMKHSFIVVGRLLWCQSAGRTNLSLFFFHLWNVDVLQMMGIDSSIGRNS